MKDQFFFKLDTQDKDGKPVEKIGSFALSMVIRTMEYEPGKLVVLLNDWHSMTIQRQIIEKNKPVVRNSKEEVCSEIYMNEEDSKRYRITTEYFPGFVGFKAAKPIEDTE